MTQRAATILGCRLPAFLGELIVLHQPCQGPLGRSVALHIAVRCREHEHLLLTLVKTHLEVHLPRSVAYNTSHH